MAVYAPLVDSSFAKRDRCVDQTLRGQLPAPINICNNISNKGATDVPDGPVVHKWIDNWTVYDPLSDPVLQKWIGKWTTTSVNCSMFRYMFASLDRSSD